MHAAKAAIVDRLRHRGSDSAVAQRATVQFTTPGLVTKHLSAKKETVLLQASITSSVQSSSFLKALTSGTVMCVAF
ncbi:hypothetical protein U9M48_017622 [Paspalum notatum var. saurae]|uniref:Uncharacterized protein n=1 Tax=Paspalum notatum var. saurae TaxID=547442 RepID=A0AAQ3TBS9_PASNO